MRRYLGLLGAVAAERLVELAVSRAHVRRAIARGAVEHDRRGYPAMVAMHALLLPACALERRLRRRPAPRWLSTVATVGMVAAEALRWWAVATLGERWTTRVLVWPDAPPVERGPYRWLRHPNYLAVVVEMACVPLAGGCWTSALAFSAANAAVLARRIAVEERALGASYERAFRDRRRLLPRAPHAA